MNADFTFESDTRSASENPGPKCGMMVRAQSPSSTFWLTFDNTPLQVYVRFTYGCKAATFVTALLMAVSLKATSPFAQGVYTLFASSATMFSKTSVSGQPSSPAMQSGFECPCACSVCSNCIRPSHELGAEVTISVL